MTPNRGDAPLTVDLGELEARCGAVAARLQEARQAATAEARDRVKGEIIRLFRDVDDVYERIAQLRERVRSIVEEYRGESRADVDARRAHSDVLNSSTYVERGWNFLAAEKPEDAVAALEKALDLAPDNLEAEGLLGWALIKAGRHEPALRSLQRVLRAEPSNDMARVNLGLLCLERKIYGEAREHLTRALELGRDRKASLYALLYLGILHAERGELDEALGWLRKAVDAGPNLIEARYHMGRVLYRSGKVEDARAVWEGAVAQNRYNPYSKKAKVLLDDLESGRPLAIP